MVDYIISTRSARLKDNEFGNEPGPTRFLAVPGNQLPKPSHQIKSVREWEERVMAEALPGADGTSDHPIGDILIYIHGYNTEASGLMWRHRRLKADLAAQGYEGAVVSFSWPSADSPLNYLEDRSDAKATALQLVKDGIIRFCNRQVAGCEINVHLLAHSTGAYVIREAFDDADDRPRIAAHNWTVSQVAFIAGDVSSKSMGESDSKSSSIYRHCVRLTNYASHYDKVLKLSNVKRVGVAPRVGRIGLPRDASSKAVNVDCSDYFCTLEESESEFKGTWEHSWHVGNEVFARDLYLTMCGDIDRHSIPTREHVGENRLKLSAGS